LEGSPSVTLLDSSATINKSTFKNIIGQYGSAIYALK